MAKKRQKTGFEGFDMEKIQKLVELAYNCFHAGDMDGYNQYKQTLESMGLTVSIKPDGDISVMFPPEFFGF